MNMCSVKCKFYAFTKTTRTRKQVSPLTTNIFHHIETIWWGRLVVNGLSMHEIATCTRCKQTHFYVHEKTCTQILNFFQPLHIVLNIVQIISGKRSQQRCFVKKDVLKNVVKFTGKQPCQSLFLIKLQALGLSLPPKNRKP